MLHAEFPCILYAKEFFHVLHGHSQSHYQGPGRPNWDMTKNGWILVTEAGILGYQSVKQGYWDIEFVEIGIKQSP